MGQGSAGSGHGGAVDGEARGAVALALGAAEAVLSVEALAVVGAASSAVGVLVQRRSVEVGLAAFVHGLDAGSGGGRRCSSAAQSQAAVGEVALLLGLAVGERVGVPQAVGVREAANAVLVVVTAVVAAASQASSLAAAVSEGALRVSDAASALGSDVGTAGGGAGSDGIVAELARPSAAGRGNAVLAVVEGAGGGGHHGHNGNTGMGSTGAIGHCPGVFAQPGLVQGTVV